jgi:restriction system protein
MSWTLSHVEGRCTLTEVQQIKNDGLTMAASEQVVWGIHAGKAGDAHYLFLSQGLIGLGWDRIPDLNTLGRDRDAFKAMYAAAYPQSKSGAIPTSAGQLFRFAHEMKPGDLVVYPSKSDRMVNIGRVEGGYRFDTATTGYPHVRPVKWLKSVPRTHFTQGALYEIGSALSLFQVKTFADEFIAGTSANATPAPTVADDPTVAAVTGEIEINTRDFILKMLAQELKGHPFAEFIGHLLNTMGYRSRVSPEGPDGGVDIIAHRDELGFEPPIIKVQVKSTEGSVGDPVVSALYGKVGHTEFGLVVTLGTFTTAAVAFARAKANLRLIGGDELVDLILAHYDQFDPRYKASLPLKRVFVPDRQEDAG